MTVERKDFVNEGTWIGLCLIYGLNAIARAIANKECESTLQLYGRVCSQMHINEVKE